MSKSNLVQIPANDVNTPAYLRDVKAQKQESPADGSVCEALNCGGADVEAAPESIAHNDFGVNPPADSTCEGKDTETSASGVSGAAVAFEERPLGNHTRAFHYSASGKLAYYMPRRHVNDDLALSQVVRDVLTQGGESIVYDEGHFYVYDADVGIFNMLSAEHVAKVVQSTLAVTRFEVVKKGRVDRVPVNVTDSRCRGVLGALETEVASGEFFVKAPSGLALRDGFLRLDPTGSVAFVDHSADNRARHRKDFDYQPEATCPRWEAFLRERFQDEADAGEKIEALQEFFGAALFGFVHKFHKVLYLWGVGRAGKGVITNVMREFFPEGSVSAVNPAQWSPKNNRFAAVLMLNKLLNMVGEVGESRNWGNEAFKTITGGDSVMVEKKGVQGFSTVITCGQVLTSNELPLSTDRSNAWWERFVLVRFERTVSPEHRNPNLAAELLNEAPGILNWLLEGAKRALANGRIIEPASSKASATEARRCSSAEASFLAECKDDAKGTPARKFYNQYDAHCRQTNSKPMSEREFGLALSKMGVEVKRRSESRYYLKVHIPPDTEGGDPSSVSETLPF